MVLFSLWGQQCLSCWNYMKGDSPLFLLLLFHKSKRFFTHFRGKETWGFCDSSSHSVLVNPHLFWTDVRGMFMIPAFFLCIADLLIRGLFVIWIKNNNISWFPVKLVIVCFKLRRTDKFSTVHWGRVHRHGKNRGMCPQEVLEPHRESVPQCRHSNTSVVSVWLLPLELG